jgi:hypothetical protein
MVYNGFTAIHSPPNPFLSVTPEHPAQHAQSFSWRARRPPGGFRGRMQDVVCQFVGFVLVPRYVMKADGVEGTLQHGSAKYSMFYYINYVHYITYYNWNELIDIIDII